ncbi:MAG: hypothetical protein U1F98_02320 [Verrucomicrobiota bacterium]
MQSGSVIWWMAAFCGLVLLLALGSRFTPHARIRRRLRKTHRRLISRSHRPSVQLSVKTRKPRR